MSSRTTPAPNRRSGYRLPLLPLLLLLAIVTAQRAGNGGGYREAPAVKIRKQGTVSGVEVPLVKIGARAWTYLGIPYARPPLGDLRFAPPDTDPPPAWHGLRNGSVHMPACVQYPPARQRPVHQLFANVAGGPIRTSEDCLYLNVYRPEGKPSTTGRQKGSFRRGKFIAKIRPLICPAYDHLARSVIYQNRTCPVLARTTERRVVPVTCRKPARRPVVR